MFLLSYITRLQSDNTTANSNNKTLFFNKHLDLNLVVLLTSTTFRLTNTAFQLTLKDSTGVWKYVVC